MLKGIRTIAVTGTTVAAAGLVTLSTTAASATTTMGSAPGHITMPRAAETTGCVTQTFDINDQNIYEQCVAWEQVLLNDLYDAHIPGPNQRLSTDGYYGPKTTSDVRHFQTVWILAVDGMTGPLTWAALCAVDKTNGFTGVYWRDAGCATEPGA
jgi:peptidoglycan hydrolase-like protein with peptidoglycan-binding domain